MMTYNDCVQACRMLALDARVTAKVAGYSRERRELTLLRLGDGRPSALYVGAHHGRESVTSAILTDMCVHLLKSDAIGRDLTIDVLPMVNPDGVTLAAGRSPLWKSNAAGVDINRNYPAGWENLPALSPGPERHRGPAPASEPETRAVMKLCYENKYDYAVSLHTSGREVFYADALSDVPASFTYAARAAAICGYELAPVTRDPAMLGGFENWFRLAFSRPALLIETDGRISGRCLHGLPLTLAGIAQ